MTAPSTAVGVEVAASQELVAGADRLGLQWQLRPATVLRIVDASSVLAVYDGDTEPVPMIQLVGGVGPNDRVYAMFVPPQGNYIISLPAHQYNTDIITTDVAATQTTVGAAELDLTRLSWPAMTLRANHLYRWDINIITTMNVLAVQEYEFRLRSGTALTGTLLAGILHWNQSSVNGQWASGHQYFVPVTDMVTTLFTSVIRNSGVNTLTVFYDQFSGGSRTTCSIRYLGPNYRLRLVTT